jgi:hypothetical protein
LVSTVLASKADLPGDPELVSTAPKAVFGLRTIGSTKAFDGSLCVVSYAWRKVDLQGAMPQDSYAHLTGN